MCKITLHFKTQQFHRFEGHPNMSH